MHLPCIRERMAVSAISDNMCRDCLAAEQNAGQSKPVNPNASERGFAEFEATVSWVSGLAAQVLYYDPLSLPGYPTALETATWNAMLRNKPYWVHIEAILIEEPWLDDLLGSGYPIPPPYRTSLPSTGMNYENEPQIELPLPRSPMSAYLGRGMYSPRLMVFEPMVQRSIMDFREAEAVDALVDMATNPQPCSWSYEAFPPRPWETYSVFRPVSPAISPLMPGPPVSPTINPTMPADDPDLSGEDDMELDDTRGPNTFDWLDESTWTSAANPRPPGREPRLIMQGLDY